MMLLSLVLALVGIVGRTCGTKAVIRNDRRMLDSSGTQMDVHMQDIHRWDPSGLWYLYAMQFGTCLDTTCCDEACGCRTDVNLTVHTSPDLSDGSWVLRSAVALSPSQRPANATFGRPKVIYNAATDRYVLWVNWFPFIGGGAAFMSSGYQTLVSSSPVGPFVSMVVSVPTLHAAGGDLGLFLDSDGAGYVIYTSIASGHRVSVERLTDDFTNTTQNNSGLLPFPGGCFESPVMFARGKTIFALSAPCCCNCAEGSTVMALRSTGGPFGPFVPAGVSAANLAVAPPPAESPSTMAQIPPAQDSRRDCKLIHTYENGDFIGGDLCEFNMSVPHGTASLNECAAACCSDPRCEKFGTLLHPPNWKGAGQCPGKPVCVAGALCCYLKDAHAVEKPSRYPKNTSIAGSVTPSLLPPPPLPPPPPAPACPHCVVSNLNHSQQGTVVAVPSADTADVQYLWVGDRWKSAPDHRKGHDLTVFTLLNFSDDGLSIGALRWSPTVQLR